MRDRVIVITGASSGIGAALAELCGARGAKLMLAARRAAELAAVAERAGGAAFTVADVGRRGDVERVAAAALERYGHIDVWVNNAGQGISKLTSQLGDDDFDAMMRSNCKSALYGMQAVLPHFQARGRGHIINVSSLLGRVPFAPIRSAYSAAKHALNALTACLRMELRAQYPDIHVSTVSPGVVATDFGLNAVGGGLDSRTLPGAQPVGEVAEVIAELIEHPRADVYSRPGYRDRVVEYFSAEDMGQAEAGMMLGAPSPPRR
jgi:NADP-dependent 3-hydroxy acid dehydrogenase YdfG